MFGKNLKNIRISRELSQEKVAEALGLTKQAISAYELNIRPLSPAILVALADYFECSTDYLLGRSESCK